MKSTLIELLETVCPNVYLQGTLAENAEYPESFITFWTYDTNDKTFYDNNPHNEEWKFSIIFYSSDPLKVETKPAEIRAKLKQAGFIPQGKGNDIPSDRPSHTGWVTDYIYKEKL